MKLISAILLSALILTVNIHCGLHLLVYEIGKPILVEKYCVNKSFNQDCEALCHVSKVIKEISNSTNQENNIPAPEVEFKQVNYIKYSLILINPIIAETTQSYSNYTNFYSFSITRNLFHPPNNIG